MCVVITVAMLLTDFGPFGIIFLNLCVIITVAMVTILRDFGPCRIIFMTMSIRLLL
jgi:hypothetical protein